MKLSIATGGRHFGASRVLSAVGDGARTRQEDVELDAEDAECLEDAELDAEDAERLEDAELDAEEAERLEDVELDA